MKIIENKHEENLNYIKNEINKALKIGVLKGEFIKNIYQVKNYLAFIYVTNIPNVPQHYRVYSEGFEVDEITPLLIKEVLYSLKKNIAAQSYNPLDFFDE